MRRIRTSEQVIKAARMLASRGEGWEDIRRKLKLARRDAEYFVRAAEADRQRRLREEEERRKRAEA